MDEVAAPRRRLAAVLISSMLLGPVLLVACEHAPQSTAPATELQWARAALARNPALEVVAVDESAQVIRVRDRASGASFNLRPDELLAMPAATAAPDPNANASNAAATVAPAPKTAITEGVVPAAEPAEPPDGERARAGDEALARSGAVPVHRDYDIERDANGVTITGPGVQITTHPGSGIATTSTGALAPAEGLERRNEPLHCQGARFLRLDSQRLAFAGNGIVAEKGCELYLTNSRVEALGTALIADGSKVHLTNSTLIGGTGSLSMQHGAEAYVGGSTLKGISRRFDSSQLHDLGGNLWD
jgi:hypothetical protein